MYTRSIPIYSGYPPVTTAGVFPPYNTYFNFSTMKPSTWVDENTVSNVITGGTGMNHTADKKNGTYYVMINASGYKNTGKETHITQYPTEAINGYDYNANGYSDGRVWWNAISNTLSAPNYATIKITDSAITINAYQITGAKSLDTVNGITYEVSSPEGTPMTRSLIDTITINKSDRI